MDAPATFMVAVLTLLAARTVLVVRRHRPKETR